MEEIQKKLQTELDSFKSVQKGMLGILKISLVRMETCRRIENLTRSPRKSLLIWTVGLKL